MVPPMGGVLPSTNRRFSALCNICPEWGVPVVPLDRHIVAGGALADGLDWLIWGVARMNSGLEDDYDNVYKGGNGPPNLSVDGAVARKRFFYAPLTLSQLAAQLRGIMQRHEFGRAHCPEYGVDTNNLMGLQWC